MLLLEPGDNGGNAGKSYRNNVSGYFKVKNACTYFSQLVGWYWVENQTDLKVLDAKKTFKSNFRMTASSAASELWIMKEALLLFDDLALVLRCFLSFLLQMLEYCPLVCMSAAASHLCLRNRVVPKAMRLIPRMLLTRTRVPFMTGFPWQIVGSMLMRSFMMFYVQLRRIWVKWKKVIAWGRRRWGGWWRRFRIRARFVAFVIITGHYSHLDMLSGEFGFGICTLITKMIGQIRTTRAYFRWRR